MTLLTYQESLRREFGLRPVTLKVAILLVLFTFIGIPCAFPFGSASVSTPVQQRFLGHNQQSDKIQLAIGGSSSRFGNQFQVKKLWTRLRSNTLSTVDETVQQKDWKNGEIQAGFLSRLLYFYAEPLLRLSATRPLEIEDAFRIPKERSMEVLVPSLQQIYNRSRVKSLKRIEEYESKSESAEEIGKFDLKKRMRDRIDRSQTLTLAKAIFIHQKAAFIKTGVLRLINTIIQAFPAVLISRLLRLIELGEDPSRALLTAVTLITLLTVKMIVENKFFYNVVRAATEIRGSLIGMIFDKSLHISGSSFACGVRYKGESTSSQNETAMLGSGSVINLMQSDATVVETLALQIHTLWDGLLQISIYATLLFKYLGKPVVWGILVLLLTIPTNSLTLRVLNRMSKAELDAKDARSKKTTEAIQNMKLLKLQGWVSSFQNDILIHRTDELKRYLSKGKYKALNTAISNAVPAVVLVVTLIAYRATGKPLLASTIFTAISLFNQLRFPLFFYPNLIDAMANGKNSLRRLSSFLSQDELRPYVHYLQLHPTGGNISMTNGNFLWSTSQSLDNSDEKAVIKPALRGVDLNIQAGECVAVIGPVGSGKSALIKALLGELTPVPRLVVDQSLSVVEGDFTSPDILRVPSVVCTGAIGYCAQEAWLTKGTLKDAILFGRSYDRERYLTAICASGLDSEIYSSDSSLSHDTNVGEGGSSLSGGQRARVQLARALYGDDVGVYLLDDPLSALDSHVGAVVFERLLNLSKQRKAATIIVTHDPSVSRRCDRVILMGKAHDAAEQNCCHIVDVGTYDELILRGHDIRNINISDKIPSTEPVAVGANDTAFFNRVISKHKEENLLLSMDIDCQSQKSSDYNPEYAIEPTAKATDVELDRIGSMKRITNPTTLDDEMSKSTIPLSTYIGYFKSMRSPLLVTVTFLSFLTANGAQLFQQYIIAKWTELDPGVLAFAITRKYLNYLMYAAAVSSLFLWLRSFLLMLVGTRASTYLYNKLLTSVFRAPMTFFDTTPSGQLLSRFGREMDVVDRSVPDGIGSVLFCFLQISLSIIALAGAVTPLMLLPIFGIGALYVRIMSLFRPAARELKRCESKSRSPIYTQFGEALRGVEIIRSFPGAVTRWSSNNRHLVDRNFAVFYSIKALDRWLSVRLETLGNVVVLVAAITSIFLTRTGTLKAGTAGWGLTQALSITGLLTWAVRVLTDLESQMMSVVRVSEMINDRNPISSSQTSKAIPFEFETPGLAFGPENHSAPSLHRSPSFDKSILSSGWPWNGGVEFKNVSMRYHPGSPLVLKKVNLSVPPGSTLAVVGKTGSGKSSLLLTLFRLVEIEKLGSIEIDHVDIRSVSLQSLREVLSIIPQDPVLFAGTLKYNLDATGKVTEVEAWRALEAACPAMAREAKASGLGLDFPVSEGGKNMSAGQRQLVCLARALVRKSKILVMDEATSSIDQKTDYLVQKTIQREFVQKGVSVITVAHRLDTILGYDKIAVFGAGEVLEYDTPANLLARPNGELRMLFDAYRSSRQRVITKEVEREKEKQLIKEMT